jgi:WD40-like Beta Propeller Repeat
VNPEEMDPMNARRLLLATLAWLCAAAGLAFAGAPAQARTVHIPATPAFFGSKGSGPGQFNEPKAIAVNDATHDVYVVDAGNNRVEEFNSTGTYIGEFNGSGAKTGAFSFSEQTGIAVDNSGNPLDPSAGDVYVIDGGHRVVDKFSAAGTYEGQLTGSSPGGKPVPFGGLGGVAVAPSGEVWVAEYGGNIFNFSDAAANQYLGVRGTTFGSGTSGLAVDPEGNLYLRNDNIIKLTGSGKTLMNPFCGEARAYAVAGDWTSGEVFVDNGESIGVCGLGGEPLSGFGSGDFKFGEYGGSNGVAVDESDGAVYATAIVGDEVLVFDAITLPSVSIGALSEQTPRSVTLNGTVNPEGFAVTSCVFEYDTREYKEGEGAHGTSVPCSPASLGEGSSPVPVSAHLSGLKPETRYDYRLVAENSAHIPSATANQEFTAGPVLGGEFVTNVASESATLGVSIDPNGDDTHYYFQYGPGTSYGSYAPAPPPGMDLGAGDEAQPIGLHLQALQPGTLYHYRVVVSQGGEEFAEPDRTFTTQSVVGGPALPDGRAWELVSPAHKNGALIEPFSGNGDEIQAASNGSAIAYLTAGPALGEDPRGLTNWSQTLSMRVPGGWRSEDLTLPKRLPAPGSEEGASSDAAKPEYQLFSADLSLAAVQLPLVGTPPLSPEASERTVYLRDDRSGSFAPLVTAGNTAHPEEHFGGGNNSAEEMFFVTGTPDLSHVLLATPFALTPEAVYESSYVKRNQWNLYEWSAGRLQLVNILPEGEPTRGPEPLVRLAGGTVNEGNPVNVIPSAVSSDGRRIAWDLGEPHGISGGYVGLYVRDMVEERTVKVGGPNAVFQWMSSDGSKVFYLEGGDLYVYGFDTGTRTDLTADHAAGEADGGVQESVSDVGGDGSYVYFVAKGVLAGAAEAVSGGDNLYLLHDAGGVWSTTYIATLSGEDEPDWYAQKNSKLSDLSRISSRVSPDGRRLAFMSNRPLTGYDNTDALSGHADEEVFLYDAQTGRLVCASCDPTGARPVGVLDQIGKPLLVDRHEAWTGRFGAADPWLAGSVPGWDAAFGYGSRYQPRYLSDSGRLFFDSPDALVPRATNGVENVFEYEPAGVGSCTEAVATGTTVYAAAAGGCVGLISAGTSGQESAFFDASETGGDVFFITAARLVGADYDNAYDVYDAHVCGSEGVACAAEPVSPPPCSSGDSCKAAPSPQPEIFGPAPSATFNGAGNVTPSSTPVVKKKTVKCPKGKKLSHGKCIKAKAKHKTKAHKAKKATTNRRAKR